MSLRNPTVFVLMGLCMFILAPAAMTQNLVTNPGFETGDLTGWTSTDGFIRVNTDDPHSGTYALYLSSNAPDKFIYQAITTTAGDEYNVSFWLTNDFVRNPLNDHFAAYFGGSAGVENGEQLLDVTNMTPQPYSEYTYTVTADSSSTYLQFFENNVNDVFYLDDVAVTAVSQAGPSTPEPSAFAAFVCLSFTGLCVFARRRRAGADSPRN